jgi:hypothetical protein
MGNGRAFDESKGRTGVTRFARNMAPPGTVLATLPLPTMQL